VLAQNPLQRPKKTKKSPGGRGAAPGEARRGATRLPGTCSGGLEITGDADSDESDHPFRSKATTRRSEATSSGSC